MARLVNEMRSDVFLAAHPVIQAAYAHYGLVVIHPFADGNGRVARALASVFTYRAISMPIMILSDERSGYLDSLEEADRGDYQVFAEYMLARSLDTMKVVEDTFLEAALPSAKELATAISGLYITKGGFTEQQVDDAGRELTRLVVQELQRVVSENIGPQLRGNVSLVGGITSNVKSDSHRPTVENAQAINVQFSTPPPAQAQVWSQMAVWLPKDAGQEDDAQVVVTGGASFISIDGKPNVVFSARMDEMIPTMSSALQIRVSLFAEREIRRLLTELKSMVERALPRRR
jgi:hypothetical protein